MDSTTIPRGIPGAVAAESTATPTPTRPDPCVNGRFSVLHPVPATASLHAAHADSDRTAARIAAVAVQQLDEFALIGYPILDPATRAVYEATIRLVARGVLES